MSSWCGNIWIRSCRETSVPPWSPPQQWWVSSFYPAQVSREKSKSAFDRKSRCRTEVSRRLAGQRFGARAREPADRPCPAIHSLKEQLVSPDRGSLFELPPGLGSQERIG